MALSTFSPELLVPVNVGKPASEFYNSDDSSDNEFITLGGLKTEQSNEWSRDGHVDKEEAEEFFPELSDDEEAESDSGDRNGADGGDFEDDSNNSNDSSKDESKQSGPAKTPYRRVPGDTVQWQCAACPFSTAIYSRMRYHSKMAHLSAEERIFPCNICSKKLASSSSLETHMKIHNGKKRTYGCPKCDWSFGLKHHLERHTRLVHGKNAKKSQELRPFQRSDGVKCEKCDKTLANLANYRLHMKKLHGIEMRSEKEAPKCLEPTPSPCPQCGQVLKNEMALKVHMAKKHPTPVEPSNGTGHVCDYCSKRFAMKSELRYHTIRHTGDYKHVCQKCNLGYPTQSELNKHLKRSKKCGVNGDKEKPGESSNGGEPDVPLPGYVITQ